MSGIALGEPGAALAALLLAGIPVPQEPSARLAIDPPAVEVGLPVRVTLEVEHSVGGIAHPGEGALALDDSWVVLGFDRALSLADPKDPARARTIARWTIASLEPGERELPDVEVELSGGASLVAGGPVLSVAGVLGPGEDAPRPPKGFRARSEAAGRAFWPLAWAAAIALALLAAALWRARARRRPAVAPGVPSALELLADLEARELGSEDERREAFFEISRAVREEIDRRRGVDRSGRTDQEWLASAAAELEAGAREELAALLEEGERIKYGGERPTHWAVREAAGRARAALEGRAAAEVAR